MNASRLESLENDLINAGKGLPYPPTPALASAVISRLSRRGAPRLPSRRWAWALVAVLFLFSVLMLVPPARAAILDFIQIGVVRIFRGQELPPAPPPTARPPVPTPGTPQVATFAAQPPVTATPAPSFADLAGETTLREAEAAVSFRVLLPTFPADLGDPDRVYLQHPGDSMLILVWLDPSRPGRVRMSLHEIAAGSWAVGKFNPPVVQDVRVNGRQAAWAEGPYMIELRNGNYVQRRLVAGHVLIWEVGDLTLRLESDLPLDEAIRVAESVKPVP